MILKNLIKKSLISSFIKNGIQFFSVHDVNNLLAYIDRKRRFVDHQRDFVIDIIPKMEELQSSLSSQPRVHYYEGVPGVEAVMNDCLKDSRLADPDPGGERPLILCITSPEKWLHSDLNQFIKDFIKERVIELKMPIRTLSKDTAEARCFFDEYACDPEMTEVRYIQDDGSLFDNIVHVYNNKVAIVSPERGFEFGVMIESEEFARTQRSLFELAWKGALVHNGEYNNDYED